MKKVININFQGRVIPIEESAYDILKVYIDSLRRYFANDEGRDEIVNDIESRIGELFAERLKNGTSCITDEDVNNVIAGMGRPEEFDPKSDDTAQSAQGNQGHQQQSGPAIRGRLYRNEDDKIVGGVCSGLASYLNIDPIITRIIFVLLVGVLFWVYVLLWVIIPSRSIQSRFTKRLYRSTDDHIVAGVAGGLAAYFNIAVWIPRVIFALPFILALISGSMNVLWWDWDWPDGFAPRIISGSLGSTMFVTYLILWIAVPEAKTAAEKLEMRGEKVNFNSIANTVKEDLEQFRVKAEKWGNEVRNVSHRHHSGLGRAIRILLKAFFIFIFSIIAFSLFGAFIGVFFGGMAFAPLQGFIFDNNFQQVLAWVTVLLLLLLPAIAFITWGVRRMMGVRSRRHAVGYVFLALWIVGLLAAVVLTYSVFKNFSKNVMLQEEPITLAAPGVNKMYVDVQAQDWKKQNHDFFGFDVDGDFPWYFNGNDSLMINTVRISMVKSNDTAFHVYRIRGSRGSTPVLARKAAGQISFEPVSSDSTLIFPRGFTISREEKFRNQRVWIVVEVPVGKRIEFGNRIGDWDWVDMNNRRNGDHDDSWDDNDDIYEPTPGREYIMNDDGRPRVFHKSVGEI